MRTRIRGGCGCGSGLILQLQDTDPLTVDRLGWLAGKLGAAHGSIYLALVAFAFAFAFCL